MVTTIFDRYLYLRKKMMMAKLETDLIHQGEHFNTTRSVVPPIYQTATYYAGEHIEEQISDATTTKPSYFYHRHGNPTNNQVAELIATLEKKEDALVLATGMAAISTAILAVVQAGDHIIAQHAHYSAASLFFKEFVVNYGIEITHVEQTDNQAFEQAIQANTKLIYIETPSNPNLEITDLAFIGTLAKKHHIFTIVDNTFASPINQTPADFGIDAIVHSATKYLGGHSDLTAGVICGTKEYIHRTWRKSLVLGASLSPFDSWLLLRGIKTLSLRVKQINENALLLASWLETQAKVKRVIYTGLPSHPQHKLAQKQMKGFTGMLCVEMAGSDETQSYQNAQTVMNNVQLFSNAVSLGGVESLITHPASIWAPEKTKDNQSTKANFPLGLLRISVGIEHIDDLIADVEQALDNIR